MLLYCILEFPLNDFDRQPLLDASSAILMSGQSPIKCIMNGRLCLRPSEFVLKIFNTFFRNRNYSHNSKNLEILFLKPPVSKLHRLK
jgi:hypothetical protein